MKRVLIVADCPTLTTGYSRLGRFIAKTLTAEYQVRYLPCNATNPEYTGKFNYTVDIFDPLDRYNTGRIGSVISDYKPSLVIVIGEFAYVGYVGNACRQVGIKSLYYMPVEGKDYPPQYVFMGGGNIDFRLTLSKFDYIVAYSQFGKEQIHKQLPGIVYDVIYHQIDTNIFKPVDKNKVLSLYLPNLIEKYEKDFFIVGAVYRNMRRKGVDYLFKGFKYFLEKYKPNNAYLMCLMDSKEPDGYNLVNFIEKYGLQGHIITNDVVGGIRGPDDYGMSEIYNCFDVHCLPFRAGGFEYPIIESLACGVRTVCTRFATPAEYADGVADFVDPIDLEPCISTNMDWAVLNPKDVGDVLGKIYLEGNTKEPYYPGVELASNFSEEIIAKKWLRLLKDLQLPEMPELEKPIYSGNAIDSVVDSYLDSLN